MRFRKVLLWVLPALMVVQVWGGEPAFARYSGVSRVFTSEDLETLAEPRFAAGRAGDMSYLPAGDDKRLLIPYLMGSAEGGHVELVKKLLEQGADPSWGLEPAVVGGSVSVFNLLLEQGCTAGEQELAAAAEAGSVEIVKLLLNPESELWYPLSLAVRAGRMHVVKLLLEHGAKAEHVLDEAVETGNVEMVKLLLEKGSYPYGFVLEHAMSSASWRGYDEIVLLLLEKGAPASEALPGVAGRGDWKMVRLLLEHGAHADAGMPSSAEHGHEQIVKLLLEKGADANSGIPDAAEHGQVKIVKLLLEAGAYADNGISEAAAYGHGEVVRLLLEHGADAGKGLVSAAEFGQVEMVRFLLAHGASPESALIPAVEKGYVEIVEMLHHAGARLPQEHLLPLAVKAGNPAMVEYLAKFGCSPTAGLGGAVERGDIEMTRLLLDMGAVPGGFELRAAAQHGYAEILKLILPLAQAEINAANWQGQTPLDLAVQNGHEECAALLRAAGGR
ncbi:MAG: ankyrin repeat domain-containing protein [Akkermansia sp.]|nr:ankyrin repeat domain-containing protein [Akkermansia sp.]